MLTCLPWTCGMISIFFTMEAYKNTRNRNSNYSTNTHVLSLLWLNDVKVPYHATEYFLYYHSGTAVILYQRLVSVRQLSLHMRKELEPAFHKRLSNKVSANQKAYLISFIYKEIQIKTIIRYHYKPTKLAQI